MFGKKSLSELVAVYLAKNNERREKISGRIATLEAEGSDINGRIENVTRQLVDCELSDDQQGQVDCNKTIRELQLNLDRVDGLIHAFRVELDKGGRDEKALVNIRASCSNGAGGQG